MKIYFKGGIKRRQLIKAVAEGAAAFLGQSGKIELSVSFFSKKEMRKLNSDARGIDAVTDVLSFPALPLRAGDKAVDKAAPTDFNPESRCVILGEIVICGAVAQAQAVEYGHSEEREYAFLFLHGLLHLLGYDHIKKSDAKLMESLADRILTESDILR